MPTAAETRLCEVRPHGRLAHPATGAVFDHDVPYEPGTWVDLAADGTVTLVAQAGGALADTLRVAAAYRLDPHLPQSAEREADAWVRSPGIDDPSLTDLTHLALVTIDEQTSKDLDQAVFIEASEEGYTVWYAIADASHFVRPGMALWEEAVRRGSTCYLPGLVVPMLPRSLSEDLISLNPGVVRRALVFEHRLDAEGRCLTTRVHRARVRSRCKTWFDAVQSFLDGGPCPSDDPAVAPSLRLLQQVGTLRIRLAEERSMASYRRRPLEIELPDRGARYFVALTGLRNEVERYNEQISILCNVEGAKLLRDAHDSGVVQPIFRVHDAPPESAVERFQRQLEAFASAHQLDPARWVWTPEQPLATWLEELPHDGREGQLARAVHRMALHTNTRSTFQVEPARHHGVGAEVYSRFTAPMREVVGIYVHKELCEALGFTSPRPRREDEATVERIIDISHRARSRQASLDRDMNRVVLDQLFHRELLRPEAKRAVHKGLVLGVTKDKVRVQLDDAPLDLKIYVQHLQVQLGSELTVDDDEVALRDASGQVAVAIGDTVAVRVLGLDTERDRYNLHVERLT